MKIDVIKISQEMSPGEDGTVLSRAEPRTPIGGTLARSLYSNEL